MLYKRLENKGCKFFAVLLLSLALAGCGSEQTAGDQGKASVRDSAGAAVEIPAKIDSVADAWPAHNEVLVMLGAGEKIKATVNTKSSQPWLYKVNPALNDASVVFTPNDVNIEQLMQTKPDIIFVSANKAITAKLQDTGIPVVQVSFVDFAGLKECFRTTGAILGSAYKQKAEDYIAYLDGKLAEIKAVTDQIPQKQRPKVLHINALAPLLVDGTNTIIDNWIQVAGGTNAAADVEGNMKSVTMEQVMAWDPDIIIVSSNALPKEQSGARSINVITADAAWQGIKAVKNKKVYVNPEGAFLWDRYGAEEALQIQWAAKILYPEQFQAIDIVKETQFFYKTFMNYDLSEQEAARIVAGEAPEQ